MESSPRPSQSEHTYISLIAQVLIITLGELSKLTMIELVQFDPTKEHGHAVTRQEEAE